MNEAKPAALTRPVVVGIGASAGGVEALSELMPHLPAGAGLAYLVVLHLDRTHASHLTEILAKRTSMKVIEASDGERIEADCVYVIVPDTALEIDDGRLAVVQRAPGPGSHMTVDHLFAAIARERGAAGVGIVLSGTGTDGSLGVAEIKAAGGITFAQDSASAAFDGMPNSAIDSGSVDFVLNAADIGAELGRVATALRSRELHDAAVPATEDEWKRLFRMLRGMSGVDFAHYKRSTIRRRLARRMALRRTETLERYLALLQEDPAELEALYQDLLIRVTSFFRDPGTYEALAELVLPRSMQNRNPSDPIRVWVPGCSTGEEVYSLAMVLLEFLGESAEQTPIQIFGTDVNLRSIERARAGLYIENMLVDVSPERLRRFFTKQDGAYEVQQARCASCASSPSTTSTRDPPFSRLDIVSCRNVLIYLDATVQKRVIAAFPLRPPSRALPAARSVREHRIGGGHVRAPRPQAKIYQRIGAARSLVHVRDSDGSLARRPRSAASVGGELRRRRPPPPRGRPGRCIGRYAPAGRPGRRGPRGRCSSAARRGVSSAPHGAASLNFLKHVRAGPADGLSEAIDEVRNTGLPARRTRRARTNGDGIERVDIEVVPLTSRPEQARCFLVLFEASATQPRTMPAAPSEGLGWRLFGVPRKPAPDPAERRERDDLKRELDATPQYLQAIIEAERSRARRSCARPTRRCSPPTRSCRAPTRSSRRPRRSCSRPTRSSPRPSTRSCATATSSSRSSTSTSERRVITPRPSSTPSASRCFCSTATCACAA